MYIAIKSEIDSRPFVYPLMKALFNYGSILVVSNNKQLRRLTIGSDDGMTFRNITIVVDEDGATDEVYEEYGFAKDDFDFVILDNVGVPECDIRIFLFGADSEVAYQDEIDMLIDAGEAKNMRIVQFGRAQKSDVKSAKKDKKDKKDVKADPQVEEQVEAEQVEYDPAEKFKSLEERNLREIQKEQTVNVQFPSFQDIETVEGEHKFYEVNNALIPFLHSILEPVIGVDAGQFRKEVKKTDESSGYIRN